jgi:hypothetical protein
MVLAGSPLLTLTGQAHAEPRLDVAATICESGAGELERRLPSLLKGGGASLRAWLRFEEVGDGVRVSVETSETSVPRGETVLVVPTCEEAVDAAVVVLSLAFSAQATGDTAVARVDTPSQARSLAKRRLISKGEVKLRLEAPPQWRDASPAGADSPAGTGSTQLSLAAGVDSGTLPTSAVFVAGSVTHSWSNFDLSSSLRYGLPTEDERVETELHENVQRDFGAVGVSVCSGVGAILRFSACTGGEFGLLRVARRLAVDGAPTRDQHQLLPRLSAVILAIVSVRRGRLRPELEFSGSVLAFGRKEGASLVALRAAAGAAVDF